MSHMDALSPFISIAANVGTQEETFSQMKMLTEKGKLALISLVLRPELDVPRFQHS